MIRLPGEPKEFKLTKLHMIGHHITASIQMIAVEANPFSTHVVVMAAHEQVFDIAKNRGVFLEWDPEDYIKDEHLPQFRRLWKKAYNYFKHADRDSEQPYDGPKPQGLRPVNEFLTAMNILGHAKLGGHYGLASQQFNGWMLMKHPEWLKKEFLESLEGKIDFKEVSRDPKVQAMALRHVLMANEVLPWDEFYRRPMSST